MNAATQKTEIFNFKCPKGNVLELRMLVYIIYKAICTLGGVELQYSGLMIGA